VKTKEVPSRANRVEKKTRKQKKKQNDKSSTPSMQDNFPDPAVESTPG